jgi:hypothetical protein
VNTTTINPYLAKLFPFEKYKTRKVLGSVTGNKSSSFQAFLVVLDGEYIFVTIHIVIGLTQMTVKNDCLVKKE